MTRREKLRQEMLDEIKAAARRQMTENGTASISLSAIARELEVSQPALYRYYANRDALITALIVDTYGDQAAALEKAAASIPHGEHRRRLMAVLLEYREWSLQHPVDFQLIYGNPIPGYSAPAELTLPAAQRIFAVILNILASAYTAGAMQPDEHIYQAAAQMGVALPVVSGAPSPEIPQVVLYIGIIGWCRIHGIITLELFHHTRALVPNGDAFYQHEVEDLFRYCGFPPA